MAGVSGVNFYPNPVDVKIPVNLSGEMHAPRSKTIIEVSGKIVNEKRDAQADFISLYPDVLSGRYITRPESVRVKYSQRLVITE